jgi:hypothetical protein
MVGFPDRADGIGDQRPLCVAILAAGEEIPHTAAEIGATEQHVGIEREHHGTGHRVR